MHRLTAFVTAAALARLVALPASLHAQWQVALLGGTAASRGDSRDELDADHPEIRADRLTVFALAIARTRGPWRIGAEVRHTGADLSEASPGAVVTTPGVLSAWGAGIEVARRVAGRSNGATLHAALGAGADRWKFDVDLESPRWRPALRAALDADLPISHGWSAVVRAEIAGSPSVFRAEELPEGFSRQAAVRSGIVLGVRRRWSRMLRQ